jgi:hypothetical protein
VIFIYILVFTVRPFNTHWVVVITLNKTILKMSCTNLHRKQIFKILIQLLFKTCFHWLLFSLKSTVDMSKLIFILQDAFHVARNIAFATVKSLTDICYSSNTILFFINCVLYPPPHTHIYPCCHGKKI